MEDLVTIPVPHQVRMMLNRTPQELGRDLRLYAALMMFQLGKLSSGAAAEMAGVPKVMFLELCSDYDLVISQITPDELVAEVNS